LRIQLKSGSGELSMIAGRSGDVGSMLDMKIDLSARLVKAGA
jgi:hypothetical protein